MDAGPNLSRGPMEKECRGESRSLWNLNRPLSSPYLISYMRERLHYLVAYTNATSLSNKQKELEILTDDKALDIIGIFEIWWHESQDQDVKITEYNLFRKYRMGRRVLGYWGESRRLQGERCAGIQKGRA